MKYEFERGKLALRRMNGIRAFKILSVEGDNLIIRNPYDREKTFNLITVKNPNNYKTGDYIDVILSRMSASSYMSQFLGNTPPDLIPENGEEIF